jgi:NhaP-type Na+/H+ or K+/H+ antiporter
MSDNPVHQIDRKTWSTWSFYINTVVFIIVGVAIFFLIVHSYSAGKLVSQISTGDELSQMWLYVGLDITFIAVGLTYIFFRLFSYYREIMRRSW